MDLIEHYTKVSREEALKNKTIRDFNDSVDRELWKIEHFRANTKVINRILHPYTTVRNNIRYTRLTKIRNEFEAFLDSSILLYEKEGNGNLIEDLESASKYYKPMFIEKYVKSKKLIK